MAMPQRIISGMLALLSYLLMLSTAWCAQPSPQAPIAEGAVFEMGDGIPDKFNYFAEVFGATTLPEAKLEFNCIRKVHPHLDLALYHIPVGVRGAQFHGAQPYGIVVASYARETEARAAMAAAQRTINYGVIMRCLRLTLAAGAPWEIMDGKNAFVFRLEAPKIRWPLAVSRSPLAPMDAISTIRALPGSVIAKSAPAGTATDAVPPQPASPQDPVHAVISEKAFASSELAGQALYVLRTLRPDVHFAAIQQGRVFYLTVAAFLNRDQANAAVRQMRERGLYALTDVAQFSSTQTTSQMVSPIPAQTVDDRHITIQPPGFDETTKVVPYSIIEAEDLVEPLTDRLKRCVSKVAPAGEGAVNSLGAGPAATPQITGRSPREFASCSGIVLSKEALTRCIMGSDCHGVRVPVGFQIEPVKLLKTCLLGDPTATDPTTQDGVNLCMGTSLASPIRDILKKAGILPCLSDAKSPACVGANAAITSICGQAEYHNACAQIPDFQEAVVGAWQNVISCVSANLCGAVVPRPADLTARLEYAATMANLKPEDLMGPAEKAFGFMDGTADAVATSLTNCLGKPGTGSDEKIECLGNLSVHSTELEVAMCLHGAANDTAAIECMSKEPRAAAAIAAAKCVQQGSAGFDTLLNCAGSSLSPADKVAAEAAKKVFDCVSESTDARDALANCASQIPGASHELQDLVGAAQCLATKGSPGDVFLVDATSCVTKLDKNGQVALCAAQAKNEADQMACVSGVLNMDPKTAQMVGCLEQVNGSDGAMAACVAGRFLPPEVARVAACATSSSGAVSFALCAAGPKMNEELRIAAECAVESGGNPLGFAGCTAGRLTVAELEKCIQGQIGTDGGCFGPNNTLRRVVEAYFQVLDEALGPNSSIGTTVRAIERFFVSVSDDVGSQADKAGNWFHKTLGLKHVFGW